MMKGAPEIVLTKCTHHMHNRTEKPIDEVGPQCGRVWGLALWVRAPLDMPQGSQKAAFSCACTAAH